MNKSKLSCSLLFAMLFCFQQGFSQTSWKGTINTYWNNPANWTNGIPDITKDAILGDANFTGPFQPKINVVSTCKSVILGGVAPATLTISRNLTVTGDFTINANGAVDHPATTMYLNGNWINNGTYTTSATAAGITFKGTNQLIGGNSLTTFRRMTVNPTSTVSLAANIKVDGASSFLGVYGVIDPGQSPTYTVTSTGLTRIYNLGKIKINAASFTLNYILTGATTFYAGSIVEYGSTSVDQVVSSAYSYYTLIISGTGTKSLAANLPSLNGSNAAYGKIYVNSGTFNLGTYTANRATTKVGGILNVADGARLQVGGLNNFPLNFATRFFGTSSTIEYNGVTQTISNQAYGNLHISAVGIKTVASALTLKGSLIITDGTFNTTAIGISHLVAGDFIHSGGAITGTNTTYNLNGTADQTASLIAGLPKLTINNTGGSVILGSDITVTTTLNFIKGNIQTGSYNVILPTTATLTSAGQATGWVNGKLQKAITTGASVSKTFEVGSAAEYSPLTVLFANVAMAGNLTASAWSVDQPEINYSTIDPAKSVNRFWSLNNAGILFTTATSTFNWVASDIDGGAITTNFKAGTFNGTNWTLPAVTALQPTSIQATGLTSFGDFAVGENISKYTWNGDAFTADWFTPKNWLGGVPTAAFSTFIPTGISGGRLYPVLTGGAGTVTDITVEAAAALTINAGTLKIAGSFSNAGTVTASAGTVEYNGAAPQTIADGLFVNNTIKDLIINNDVSLAGTDSLTGTLTIAAGKTFSTNDNLVLKSTASGTARVATLPTDGSGNATAFITGNVSIERYIPARKAWRLLSAPIKPGAISINAAWQEGVNGSSFGPNPNPGYGVHITGGTIANGFDQSPTNSPSLKVYDNTTNTYIGLPPSPGTNAPLHNYPGYLLYIRGDRSIDLMQGANAAITSTTLRMQGQIKTGSQVVNVNAANFSVMGNPYPAAIDFQTLTRNNVKNTFYLWDPKLAGSNGLGAYVTVSWNNTNSTYDITTAASPVSQYIPSGEAVLLESLDGANPGTITIKESDKTTNGSDMLFGRPPAPAQKLRTNLYAINADGSASLLDAALVTYDDDNLNIVDNDDVRKLSGASESISLQCETKLLSIERRKTITGNDTAFINLAQMKFNTYKLEVIGEYLKKKDLTAVVKDKYSGTTNNMPVDLNGTTNIMFSTNSDPASYAKDRFSIVFEKTTVAPLPMRSTAKASVAKVGNEKAVLAEKMVVFPNPVKGSVVSLQLNNIEKGTYNIQVTNVNGQLIKSISIQHNGVSATHNITFDGNLPSGTYQVKLAGSSVNLVTSLIKE